MAGKKQAPKQALEEDPADADEGWEGAEVETETAEQANLRMRDWRDVEKYRELKELRRLLGDDLDVAAVMGEIEPPRPPPPKPVAKPAAKPAARPEAKLPLRPEPKPAGKAETKPVAKPEVKHPPKPAAPVKAAKPKPAKARHPAKAVHHKPSVKAKKKHR